MALSRELASTVAVLAQVGAPWAIAGGWALDLGLGEESRAHADVDIAIFRDDQLAFRAAFYDYTCEQIVHGVRLPWNPGDRIELPVHELHVQSSHDPQFSLELLLNERDGGEWVYRRDGRVRRNIGDALLNLNGVTVLAPEIVLLFKSKAPRTVDQFDFERAWPMLTQGARAWLRTALQLTSPGHPWAEH